MTALDLPHSLTIDFVGEVHHVDSGADFTFGRQGDLEVDDNRQLHRILGRFVHERGMWWIRNEGSSISILVADSDSRSSATVAPGAQIALSFQEATVRFAAGPTEYEFEISLDQPVTADALVDDFTSPTTDTFSASSVPLTDDQRLALVILSENALNDPHVPVVVGSNAAMAHRLGWTIRRFNRKIDNLCAKYSKVGVSGLHGSSGQLATDRRRRLVEYCVAHQVVTRADLALLSADAAP